MSHSKFIAIAFTASMLTACTESNSYPGTGVMHGGSFNKADIGTAAGAIGGGVLGYQFGGGAGQALATVGGALLGGALGNSIGTSLDNADRNSYDIASQRAMETGQSQSWKNTHSGNYGTVYPSKRYTSVEGLYCREYNQTIYVDGVKHTGHGTACREEDGTWQIIE
jgi:surface antigen